MLRSGIWNANTYFALGIGVPKTFSAENWAKTAPEKRKKKTIDTINGSVN